MFRQYVESFAMIVITFGYTGFVSYLLITEILKFIK
jgi:hypothetical protein